MLKYHKAPNDLAGSFQRYVEHGIEPGSFLRFCLENDFVNAAFAADMVNRGILSEIARFIGKEIPSICWGDPTKVLEWVACEPAERAEILTTYKER